MAKKKQNPLDQKLKSLLEKFQSGKMSESDYNMWIHVYEEQDKNPPTETILGGYKKIVYFDRNKLKMESKQPKGFYKPLPLCKMI